MSNEEPQTTTRLLSKRIPELDGIRGMAILLVLFYHYAAVPVPTEAGRGFLFIRQIFSNGWSGVDLFFVLSGFLITGILIENRKSKHYFKAFYIRRITRIFPLYYFFILLYVILQYFESQGLLFSGNLFTNTLPLFPYLIYFQNFTMAAYGDFGNEFLAMTWSLAIEEQFYLFLPLIVRRTLPERLPLNIVFLIGLPLVLRVTLGSGGFYSFVLTPWRLDALFLGSLLAVIMRTPKALSFLTARLRWIKIAFSLLFLFFIYSTLTEELGSLDHLFIFGLFYASLIFLSLTDKNGILARFFRLPALKSLGDISYGIYMFHQLTNGVLHDVFFKQLPTFQDTSTVAVTVLAFIVTYLLALTTYNGFEKRFVSFGHKYRYAAD